MNVLFLFVFIIIIFLMLRTFGNSKISKISKISEVEGYQNSKTSSRFLTVPTYEPSWVYNWAYWNPFRYKYGYWPSYGIYANTYKPYPHFLKYNYGYFSPRKLYYE